MNFAATLKVSPCSDREIQIERTFGAPRAMVYACYTSPELVRQWCYGPEGWSFTVCDMDVRPGGKWRWVFGNDSGASMTMFGEYREVKPGERFQNTENMEGFPGESLVTTSFVEKDGQTTVTTIVRYASKENRDMMLKSGMEKGLAAGYARLDKRFAAIK